MKRIIYLILRCLFRIPAWYSKIVGVRNHKDDRSLEENYTIVRDIVSKILKRSRTDLQVFGQENLPEQSGYLITPNHQGLYDALALFETNVKPFKAVLKIELTKTIAVKDVIEGLSFLPMDRANLRQSVKVIKDVQKNLEAGITCAIFPEGTRGRNKNEMLEFKGGSFKAAMSAKAPIVPVAFIDSYKVFDDNSIKKVTVQMHYLDPIYYDEYKEMGTNEVAVLVQSRIKDCIERNENRF